ncbi:MAG: hypothetical protein PVJ15_07210 [Gammaproteobacteria bacterium]|jgi:hypothetical protein
MPHHALHQIQGAAQGTAQSEAQSNRALGLLTLCWLLSGGVFVAAKWAGPYIPPWTLSSM